MRRVLKYTLLFTFLLIFIINATGCSEKSGNPEDIYVDAELLSVSEGKVNVSLTVVNNSLQKLVALSCHVYLISDGGMIAAKDEVRLDVGAAMGTSSTYTAELEYIGQGTPTVSVQLASVSFASSGQLGSSLRGNVAFLAVAIVSFALSLASAALLVFAIHSKNDVIRLPAIAACAVSICVAVVTFFTYLLGAPFVTVGILVAAAGVAFVSLIIANSYKTVRVVDYNMPAFALGAVILPVISSAFFAVAFSGARALVLGIGMMIAAVIIQVYVISLNSAYYADKMLVICAPILELLYAASGFFYAYYFCTDILDSLFIGFAMAFVCSMMMCGFDNLKYVQKIIMTSAAAALAVVFAVIANLTQLWLAVAFIGALVLVFGTAAFFIRFFDETDYEGLQGFAPPAIISGAYTLALGICCYATGTFLLVAGVCSFGVAILGAACYAVNYFYEKAKHGKIPKRVYYRSGRIATECFHTAQITGISAVIFGVMLGAIFIAVYLVI